MGTNVDSRPSRLSRNTKGRKHQNAWENTQNPTSINSNHHPRSGDGSLSSLGRRDYHDMVTGANPTPRMVTEFLSGRPTQSREDPQRQDYMNTASQDNSPPVQVTTSHNATPDPLTRLADVLLGMDTKQSTQTLMVRPVSTTTLTIDGKSEKFELLKIFMTSIS